jgi:Phosphorylase superfamily
MVLRQWLCQVTEWENFLRLHHTTVANVPHHYQLMHSVEILAPTYLEYWAVRHTLPHAHVSWAGVRLARWKAMHNNSLVITCGLAGALTSDLPPGTVLIPDQVGLADGKFMQCDPILVQILRKAAQTLHFRPHTGPLLTAQSLVVGDQRNDWSRRGFVAADMETGLLAERNLRVATVRVVLDSPEHTISPNWLQPTKALLHPSLWRELLWLSYMAPCYALRAARVLHVGLYTMPDSILLCQSSCER